MASDTIVPNADSSPLQWSTFGSGSSHAGRINSGVSTPNDTNGIRSTTVLDDDRLDFTASAFSDSDVITRVDVRLRYQSNVGSAENKISVIIYIGGAPKGGTTTIVTNDSSWHDLTVNVSSWNLDWTASELAGLQVNVQSAQTGKSPVAFQIDISEIEVLITGDPPWVSHGTPFLYTTANWTAGSSMYFETYIRRTTGIAEARLYNVTDAVGVVNSNVAASTSSFIRLRSGAITLIDGKTYIAQFGAAKADAGEALGAKIINIQ